MDHPLIELDHIYDTDCLKGMEFIPSRSVDMIFSDLPYGITNNPFDKAIPAALLWAEFKRILKTGGVVLLFGQDKFTARMMLSNEKMHRYNIIWEKTTPTGFLNANRMPLRVHEDIMVFYDKLPKYHPQKSSGHKPVHSYTKHTSDGTNYGSTKRGITGGGSTERYPTSVWKFRNDKQKEAIHPQQKPIALCRYAIRTYTDPGDVVFDCCCGSGTIPLAAAMEGRRYIGFDNGEDPKTGRRWADISSERIERMEVQKHVKGA